MGYNKCIVECIVKKIDRSTAEALLMSIFTGKKICSLEHLISLTDLYNSEVKLSIKK